MSYHIKVFFSLLIASFFLLFWLNRTQITTSFDATYWKDRYEHSQWKLPLSKRIIGDDGLYLYEGYRLIHGEDPTVLNAEVPPLGKYLIGSVIMITNHPAWFGVISLVLLLSAFIYLGTLLGLPLPYALAGGIILLLDPLIASQFPLTMLDVLQSVFLLFTFFFVIKGGRTKKLLYVITAGICAGFFSETKAPLFSPFLLLSAVGILLSHSKKITHILTFLSAAAFGYILPYAPYFLMGNSLITWLKTQKWIISFYLGSDLQPTYGNAIFAIFSGSIRNIFTHVWTPIPEFSLLWPIVVASVIMLSIFSIRKNTKTVPSPFFWFIGIVFIAYNLIPFWTRYLILLLPLCFLLSTLFVYWHLPKKIHTALFALFLLYSFFTTTSLHSKTPEQTVKQFLYEWQHGFFQDMYESLPSSDKETVTRLAFHTTGLEAYSDAEIEDVQISLPNNTAWKKFESPQYIPISITYVTRHLGAFTHSTLLPLVKEQNAWKVKWDWGMLFPEFSKDATITTSVQFGKRGAIKNSDKVALAYDFDSYMVWISPALVDPAQESNMYSFLRPRIHDTLEVSLHQRAVGNSIPSRKVALGALSKQLNDQENKELLSYKGLTLTPHPARISGSSDIFDVGIVTNVLYGECCSYLYSTTSYHGQSGREKEFDAILSGQDGGTLQITRGEKIIQTLISKKPIEGKDVL